MLHQDALDLGGVDVGAAGDDQVGAAIGDEEIAVGVELAEVAGGEAAVAEGAAVLLVGVAVAEVHARRLHVDEPDLARRARACRRSSRMRSSCPGHGRPTLPGLRSHSSAVIRVKPLSEAP